MLRNVFLKSVRDQRRPLLWWGIGVAAYALLMMLFYPSIRDNPGIEEYVANMPEDIMALFAGDISDFTSPEGYLNGELFFLMAPLLFLIYAVTAGSGAIAGEEERGTLEVLLANPVTRWLAVAHKFAAMTITALALAFIFWLALVIGSMAVDMEISIIKLAGVTLSAWLLGTVFGSLALAIGSAKGNRGLSIGITGAIAVMSYLLNTLPSMVEWLGPAHYVSLFYYYIGADPLVNGLSFVHGVVLIVVAVALLAVAIVTFDRRDIRV